MNGKRFSFLLNGATYDVSFVLEEHGGLFGTDYYYDITVNDDILEAGKIFFDHLYWVKYFDYDGHRFLFTVENRYPVLLPKGEERFEIGCYANGIAASEENGMALRELCQKISDSFKKTRKKNRILFVLGYLLFVLWDTWKRDSFEWNELPFYAVMLLLILGADQFIRVLRSRNASNRVLKILEQAQELPAELQKNH